jgi:hypothetical protein
LCGELPDNQKDQAKAAYSALLRDSELLTKKALATNRELQKEENGS